MNGFLTNTGKAPLCEVRLGVDPAQHYLSIWPAWAQRGEWLDNFAPGQSVAVGFAAPDTRADGSVPALVLEDFDICGHPTRPAGGVARDPETGEVTFPRALEATIADLMGTPKTPTQAQAQAQAQHRRMQAPAPAAPSAASAAGAPAAAHTTPAGKCSIWKKGAAELAICVDSIVQWGATTQQVRRCLGWVCACVCVKIDRLLPPTTDPPPPSLRYPPTSR